jgi:hypothetical protein
MRLTPRQLRQIIREELSQLSGVIAEDKYAGYRCGHDEFDTAQEAIAHADRIAGLGASDIRVERIDTDEIIYNADDEQPLNEADVTASHKNQARELVAGTSLQGMIGLINDIAQAIADGKWIGTKDDIRRMDKLGTWGGAIVNNLTK